MKCFGTELFGMNNIGDYLDDAIHPPNKRCLCGLEIIVSYTLKRTPALQEEK
jgi:hypothetical protein